MLALGVGEMLSGCIPDVLDWRRALCINGGGGRLWSRVVERKRGRAPQDLVFTVHPGGLTLPLGLM